MGSDVFVPPAVDVTGLLLTGHHPLIGLGVCLDPLHPFIRERSTETHPDGTPMHYEVVIGGMRFGVGVDELKRVSYWTLKKSRQRRIFLFNNGSEALGLWELSAFSFLAALEDMKIAYTREIWGNAVCVVTILQSSVSLSFDLDPSIARGPASIERSDPPLYIGGDVFRKLTYD
jgi:hypothetical protein